MQHSSTYRMRVKENTLLTDPDCHDQVVRLLLTPSRGELKRFRPGQFMRIGVPESRDLAPGYFAIASAPDQPESFEFYIKNAGPLSAYLCSAKRGTLLEVEGPMGKGFDLSPFKGSDVCLVGVGTGIAPLRSLWHSIIQQRAAFGKVSIYAGFLSEMHQLLTEELSELSHHNIEVSVTLEIGHESRDGPIGYVQHALEADAPDGRNTVACLAGMSTMVDACTETLQNLGFNEDRILLNH